MSDVTAPDAWHSLTSVPIPSAMKRSGSGRGPRCCRSPRSRESRRLAAACCCSAGPAGGCGDGGMCCCASPGGGGGLTARASGGGGGGKGASWKTTEGRRRDWAWAMAVVGMGVVVGGKRRGSARPARRAYRERGVGVVGRRSRVGIQGSFFDRAVGGYVRGSDRGVWVSTTHQGKLIERVGDGSIGPVDYLSRLDSTLSPRADRSRRRRRRRSAKPTTTTGRHGACTLAPCGPRWAGEGLAAAVWAMLPLAPSSFHHPHRPRPHALDTDTQSRVRARALIETGLNQSPGWGGCCLSRGRPVTTRRD